MSRVMLCSVACFLVASAGWTERPVAPKEPQEMVYYLKQGGQNPLYTYMEVCIKEDGSATVEAERAFIDDKPVVLQQVMQLTAEEMQRLHTILNETAFFNKPEQDTESDPHAGQLVLRVTQGERSRELHYRYRSTLMVLQAFMESLVNQTAVEYQLEHHLSAMEARSAIHRKNEPLPRLLRPEKLKEPLLAFLKDCRNPAEIEAATDALCLVMTLDEWTNSLHDQIRIAKPESRVQWLTRLTMSFTGMKMEAQQAVSKLFLQLLEESSSHWKDVDTSEKQLYTTFTRTVASARPDLFPPYMTLVENPEPGIRQAVLMAVIALREGSMTMMMARQEAISTIKKGYLPILQRLAEEDKEEAVREMAKRAVQTLGR